MGINPCGSVIGVNSWESVIGMPIVRKVSGHWNNPKVLERNLRIAFCECGKFCQVRNNGKIIVALSGGIDSSLSVALIRDEFGPQAQIHTFTIGLEKDHPDIIHARIVAEKFRTIHHELIPSADDIKFAFLEKERYPHMFVGDGSANEGFGTLLLYRYISKLMSFSTVISHDGIDELLGGYWPHRQNQTAKERLTAFQRFWKELPTNHLLPLAWKTSRFGLGIALPYLQRAVIRYITAIPLEERTSKAESKIPLRRIAAKYLPPEIIQRRKLGFCDAMETTANIAKRT